MINLLIYVLVTVVILALLIYLVDLLPLPGPSAGRFKLILRAALVIIAILVIIQRVGWFV